MLSVVVDKNVAAVVAWARRPLEAAPLAREGPLEKQCPIPAMRARPASRRIGGGPLPLASSVPFLVEDPPYGERS
jgi:hypothetical protein